MILSIYVTGAIIMFVAAVLFDRSRVRQIRSEGRYWDRTWGWTRTNDRDVIQNALIAYVAIAVLWPISTPIALVSIVVDHLTRP